VGESEAGYQASVGGTDAVMNIPLAVY
jgi:hypothetical protein